MTVNDATLAHVGEVRTFGATASQRGAPTLSSLCSHFQPQLKVTKMSFPSQMLILISSVCYMLTRKSDAEKALTVLIKFHALHCALMRDICTEQGDEFRGSNETFSHSDGNGTLQTKDSLDFLLKRVIEDEMLKHILMLAHRLKLHGLAERWKMTVMKRQIPCCSVPVDLISFGRQQLHMLISLATAAHERPQPSHAHELFDHQQPRVVQLCVFGSDCYELLPTHQKVPGQQARKRLIYCGESTERHLSKTLRASASTRSSHTTPGAISSAKVCTRNCPLQADDFTGMSQPLAMRNVFSPNVSSPSQVLESGGAGGEIGMKEGISHMPKSTVNGDGCSSSSEANRQPRNERSPPTASASHRPLQHDGRRTQDQKRNASDTPRTDISSKPNALTESAPTFDDADDMGRQATLQESTRTSSLQREKTPTSTTAEESEDESDPEEEFKINSRSIRPGRLPTLRPRKSQAGLKLNEVEGASTLLNDAEADEFGPLTKAALEKERRRSKHDPSQPRRPLRLLPSGQIERGSTESKAFRKCALENNSFIQLVPNPKQSGKDSWKRYERYKLATTLRELVELSITSKKPRVRAAQVEKARADIINDYCRGYILFPQLEHNASSHFVDATKLARKVGTVNIHALFSHDEMQSASKAAAAEEKKTITELIAAHIDTAKAREVSSTPLKFHDQIRALWEYDKMIQLSDVDVKKEAAYAATLVDNLVGGIPEPATYRQAIAADHPERDQWLASMQRERSTLEGRGTWELVPRRSMGKHKPVRCKYVLKKKLNKDSSLQFKSRLVACGYSQVAGLDYSIDETYAGVCSYSSMRFLMSLICQKGYIMSQSDIQGAYLESYLNDTVYMEPPPDMRGPNGELPRDKDGNELVCSLKRGLYGLKQSGHAWSQCFKEFLLTDPKYNMGFTEFTGEPNLYRKTFVLNGRQEEILLGQYVDDLVIGASSEEARQWFMKHLEERFPVNPKSSGIISVDSPGLVLSMQIKYDREKGTLQFNQKNAIEALAQRNSVMDLKPRSMPITALVELPKLAEAEVDPIEYLSVVGSCLHIAQVSRPDIAYATGVLSRHSATPGQQHMDAAVNLINYLYNSRDLVIEYKRGESGNSPEIYEKDWSPRKSMEERLQASKPDELPNSADCFVDADYAGDTNTRRSTSGMITMMNGGPISWSSRLQKLCAQSSAESEIYAVTDSVKEAIHVKLLCEEAELRPPGIPLVIWEDNTACIHLGHGLKGSKAAKHFEVRLRFLNEQVQSGAIEFAKIDTKDQLADGFTKALGGPLFKQFRDQILHSPSI